MGKREEEEYVRKGSKKSQKNEKKVWPTRKNVQGGGRERKVPKWKRGGGSRKGRLSEKTDWRVDGDKSRGRELSRVRKRTGEKG